MLMTGSGAQYQYLQGPTGSISPSSTSPPQELHHHMSSLHQGATYDLASPLQPTHPYPFTASHSSTLNQSYPQSQFTPSTQQQTPYNQMSMGGMSTGAPSYQTYQPAGQPSSSQVPQHQRQSSTSVPYSGYTSLSTWNSMTASGQATSSNRPGSSDMHSRGTGPSGSSRTHK